MTSPSGVLEGMEVRDTHAAYMGQVQQVLDTAVLVRLQQDIYVPFDALDAVTAEGVVLDIQTAPWTRTGANAHEAEQDNGRGQVCHVCGTVSGTDNTTPFLYRGDARFCAACWRRLPAHEVERVVREVALRGVPLS